jgi:uncharacterized protein (TIGR00369 family)
LNRFQPVDSQYESKIRDSFSKQGFMHTIGAKLIKVGPGEVAIGMKFRDSLTQHHGFIHAGVITALIDNSCGYAAYTLMPANSEVLTIEYKVNFLAPARGEEFIATGKVIKPGKTISFCQGEVVAIQEGKERLIATMAATMISVGRNNNA